MFIPQVISTALPLVQIQRGAFVLQENIVGQGFYDAFNWYTLPDPTRGFVQYVDQQASVDRNLTQASEETFIMRVDHWTENPEDGRDSVRIESKQQHYDGLVVIDVNHMPVGCGTWPAFWTVTPGEWPKGGEIDIIEGVHGKGDNSATLHTGPQCAIQEHRQMSGQVVSDDCGAHSGYSGCSVKMRGPSLRNSFGDDFNQNGGGTFAMLRDHSGIKVWFWPRGSYRPGDLARAKKEGTSRVDPTKWGTPAASFPSSGCAMSHFVGHVITINTSLCGTLGSGSAFNKAGCPGTCDDCVCIFAAGSDIDIEGIVTGCRTDVAGNPEAFKDAYWEINWLRTFTIPKED